MQNKSNIGFTNINWSFFLVKNNYHKTKVISSNLIIFTKERRRKKKPGKKFIEYKGKKNFSHGLRE